MAIDFQRVLQKFYAALARHSPQFDPKYSIRASDPRIFDHSFLGMKRSASLSGDVWQLLMSLHQWKPGQRIFGDFCVTSPDERQQASLHQAKNAAGDFRTYASFFCPLLKGDGRWLNFLALRTPTTMHSLPCDHDLVVIPESGSDYGVLVNSLDVSIGNLIEEFEQGRATWDPQFGVNQAGCDAIPVRPISTSFIDWPECWKHQATVILKGSSHMCDFGHFASYNYKPPLTDSIVEIAGENMGTTGFVKPGLLVEVCIKQGKRHFSIAVPAVLPGVKKALAAEFVVAKCVSGAYIPEEVLAAGGFDKFDFLAIAVTTRSGS
jgi:hypothetical protein